MDDWITIDVAGSEDVGSIWSGGDFLAFVIYIGANYN